jgi:two-component system phosphate regulon response regulator PhoB
MTGPVLIIEDDPDIAEVLRYSLEKEHFRTRIALTGDEGLNASLDRSDPPSLILLDLLLPGMLGTEICRRLRNDPSARNIPIVLITAKPMELDSRIALQVGVDDYIIKPFSITDVVTKVRSLLP